MSNENALAFELDIRYFEFKNNNAQRTKKVNKLVISIVPRISETVFIILNLSYRFLKEISFEAGEKKMGHDISRSRSDNFRFVLTYSSNTKLRGKICLCSPVYSF